MVLGSTASCHLVQRGGRWSAGCLFSAFIGSAKLQLLKPIQRI